MRLLNLIFLMLLLSTTSISAASIVPLPKKCIAKKGEFVITPSTRIFTDDTSKVSLAAAGALNDRLEQAAGFTLRVSRGKSSKGNISCRTSSAFGNNSAYRLSVKPAAIEITAGGPQGIFYAMQTLRQLLPPQIESQSVADKDLKWAVPCVEIEDAPAFAYRGLMLDVSRHFIPVDEVKRQIDLMAFHKLNVLHWHLTDDQGWRIEIKKYPRLTSKGGVREKTVKGYMWDKDRSWNLEKHGGFYTREQIKEIVDYASSKLIEVIPEIEMPGHSVAALSAYPVLSCSGGPFEVEGRWGVFNDIYCTKDTTFRFLENVLDEIVEMFPSRYIHIGGDEAPRVRWKNCVHCQETMAREGLESEAELQTYFINRIEKYLAGKGRRIIGWDEILEGGIPNRATVMSWRGEKGGITAAKAGYEVIMTPNTHMYFNSIQEKPQRYPFGNNSRLLVLKKVYDYHPVPSSLTPAESKYIKGVQANLWTEYIKGRQQIDYMLYPRMAALAEVAWSEEKQKDFSDFCNRMKDIEMHYGSYGINYRKIE